MRPTFRFACCTALFFSSPFLAAAELEAVVVEAQKISTEVKAEAVAQSTLSSEWIDDLYVDSFEELSFFVPGLYVQEQSVNSAAYAIRGMTTNNVEATRTPRVSVWMQGMDISRQQGAYTALYDIERVDVFKGPVGSLFARGGQIGGVNITNHMAELETSGDLFGSVGSFNEVKMHGVYNQQLGENNALRLALYNHQRDGFIENSDGTDLQSVDTQAGRFSFMQMLGDTRLDIQANLEQNTPTAIAFQSFAYGPENPYEEANINNADDLYIQRDIADVLGKISHQYDEKISAELSMLYRDVFSDDKFDPDGMQIDLVEAREKADYATFESVLRINYIGDNYLSSFGAGYFHEDVAVRFSAHINEQFAIRLPAIQNVIGVPPGIISTDL